MLTCCCARVQSALRFVLESITWSEQYQQRTKRNMSTSALPASGITDFKAEDLLHVSNIQGTRLRSVLKVNFKHVYTVGQLKKIISSRHGLSVLAFLYRGVLLADEHKLVHLIPDLQNMGAPRFSVRTRLHTRPKPGGMSVQVKGLDGSTFQLHLRAMSTVADLVTAIVDYEAYSSGQDIQITCAGKSLSALDSSLALTTCNLVSESVVQVAGKLRGGDTKRPFQTFVNMENMSALKTLQVRRWKSGDPIWRIISPGLNIEGTCQNSFCEAFGKRVYCEKGFAVFNIAEDWMCPVCRSIFKASAVTFYECEWMFEGRKAGVHSIDMMSKWHVSSNDKEYQRFDDEKGRNVADWSNLVITAKPLPSHDIRGGSDKLKRETKDCAICFGTLANYSPIPDVDMACRHRAHSECMTTLQRYGYTTCPTCRRPIAASI